MCSDGAARQLWDGGLRRFGISRPTVRCRPRSPASATHRVCEGHPRSGSLGPANDEGLHLAVGLRPPGTSSLRPSLPVQFESIAMPPDHRLGPDEKENLGPFIPDLGHPNPEKPLSISRPPTRIYALEDCDLLSQGEILRGQIAPGLQNCSSYRKQGCDQSENHRASLALASRFVNDFTLDGFWPTTGLPIPGFGRKPSAFPVFPAASRQ